MPGAAWYIACMTWPTLTLCRYMPPAPIAPSFVPPSPYLTHTHPSPCPALTHTGVPMAINKQVAKDGGWAMCATSVIKKLRSQVNPTPASDWSPPAVVSTPIGPQGPTLTPDWPGKQMATFDGPWWRLTWRYSRAMLQVVRHTWSSS